ncbi:helicase conserved C-terminal domain-containing protein, putative [Babesia caballi]|uniref:ATP-dependent RNA helicase n=1 Tax=Babesia caballi TaxID=5871 RepID=A0AAV4M0A1_BABCB|nr:helicase conserved C-terminal domain-containing protein, putative [Babesia caballi]
MARSRLPRVVAALPRPTPDHVGARLMRCVTPVPADVRVWGSSLIELKPRLSPLTVRRAAQAFSRHFKHVKAVVNGNKVAPNGIQLCSIRPQLAGGDLFIAAPHQSGKTLLYLLPEAIRRAYMGRNRDKPVPQKTLVLVPTLDLVLLGSRHATGVLRRTSSVLALYYKDVVDGSYRELIPKAEVIYTTPQCALKAMLGAPNLFENVRSLILDEAQRLLKAQAASTVLRLKALLKPDVQTVVLAPRNDNMLRQMVSRALRVDMRVISFCPDYDGTPVTRHIWGPQRSAAFDALNTGVVSKAAGELQTNALERKVQENRSRVIEHSRSREAFVDRRHRCEYILYDPSKLCHMIHATLNRGTKVAVFFPTVRMTQFAYVYFKHLVKVSRPMYALHGGLSQEKRRFVIDVFSSMKKGVLFCTDITSLGLNLGAFDLVVHVGAPESVDVLADRVGLAKLDVNGCKNLFMLHDLDAHVLYEAAEHNCDIRPVDGKCLRGLDFEAPTSWVDNPCYRASCELMYRSLLGYYCNHASRLKFQRWQVPSLVYELVRSFGFTDIFRVTRQFASRLQLWDAPGLVVDSSSTRKTELQAAAAGYPGFQSRFMQTNVAAVNEFTRNKAP